MLELKDLEKIFECIYVNFKFAEDTEITIEANPFPSDMNREKIAGLKDLGVNRISLGVQSFNNQELLFLGRSHTGEDAEKILKVLREEDFNNIGIDLIFGLQDQNLEKWKKSLLKALEHYPEHLSCYQLKIEKKTVFWKLKQKGIFKPHNEEKESSFFVFTSDFLEEKGYIHYEISNFAREKALRSRHNLKYWNRLPYLGLGPSAHSFQYSRRWWNYRSVRRYCEELKKHKKPVAGHEDLTEEQRRIEIISMGLRTNEGVDIRELEGSPVLHGAVSQLKNSGHLRMHNNRILPTKKGFLVADHLPLYFIS